MCMYIHGEVEEHVAEKGFWVYKVFRQGSRSGLRTPHRNMRMQLGKLYEIPERTPTDIISGPCSSPTLPSRCGAGAFHAYRDKSEACRHCVPVWDDAIVACWVPKGTRYWLGSSSASFDKGDHICVRALKLRKIVKL